MNGNMSGNLCISTSYPCSYHKNKGMAEYPTVSHIVQNLSHRHKTSSSPSEMGEDGTHTRDYSNNKNNQNQTPKHEQREHQNELKLKGRRFTGRGIRDTGNECLFASSSPSSSLSASSSKSLILAFLFTCLACVSFCSAVDTHQHPFSVEDNIDPETAAALLDPAYHSSIFSPEPSSQFHVIEDSEDDCVKITMEQGVFHYKSRGGSRTCGLYMTSDPDKLVVVTVEYLDAQCQQGGLISVVDGWELNGAVFPSYEDHEKSHSNRFHDVCLESKQILPVRRVFTSSQNAALIQYRIPMFCQGFSIRVEHVPNPQPCNVLIQYVEGMFTLENYGRNVNCSLMTLFDSKIRLIYLNTGLLHSSVVNTFSHSPRLQRGIYHKCAKRGMEDFVQIGGSSSLDTSKTEPIDEICGYQPHPSSKSMTVFCGMTTIRLVSSGKHANKIVAEVQRATIEDLDSATYICDLGLGY